MAAQQRHLMSGEAKVKVWPRNCQDIAQLIKPRCGQAIFSANEAKIWPNISQLTRPQCGRDIS